MLLNQGVWILNHCDRHSEENVARLEQEAKGQFKYWQQLATAEYETQQAKIARLELELAEARATISHFNGHFGTSGFRRRWTMTKLRSLLYALARLLGDVQAIRKGRVGKRIARRACGKVTGRLFRGLFR
jgi:hypothetical protein